MTEVAVFAPKVSVCVITYNQERYIGACLQSLLDQRADFPFEVVVGDDHSTDGTTAIVHAFAERHPGQVILTNTPRNLGPTRNVHATHNMARGLYVAHLDGDDLADPGKLAAQASFLDAHPSVSACGHQMRVIDEAGSSMGRIFPHALPEEFSPGRAIRYGMPFALSSLMYRRAARREFDAASEMMDWYILMDMLRSGNGGFLNEVFGAYRVNMQSLTSVAGAARTNADLRKLYLLRAPQFPEYRRDFFCFAALDFIGRLRRGKMPSPEAQKLFWSNFEPRGLFDIPETYAWRKKAADALGR